jgi:hypothetical protein
MPKRGVTSGGAKSHNGLQVADKVAKSGATNRESGWTVRGISPETQNAARLAARRAGKTIGEWVDDTLRTAAMGELKGPAVPAVSEADTLKAILAQLEKRDQAIADLAGQVQQLQQRRSWLARLFGR